MKHFTSFYDVPNPESLLEEALAVKQHPQAWETLGKGKVLGLLFFNSSLRTRLSTQVAARKLGMDVVVMNVTQDSWQLEFEEGVVMKGDKAEHIKEAAAVIGRYCDILGVRAFAGLQDREEDYRERIIEAFKKYAGVPMISLESATRHPLQSLADWITIETYKAKERPRVVLTWAPHPKALPQAVANSFAEWMRHLPVELVITHPVGYELAPSFCEGAEIFHDQAAALKGADFVYAKSWASYTHYGKILPGNADWTVTAEKMALTDAGKFMHCLPVRRNVVVSDAVLDSPASLVIEQAANRVVAAQAVLIQLLQAS